MVQQIVLRAGRVREVTEGWLVTDAVLGTAFGLCH